MKRIGLAVVILAVGLGALFLWLRGDSRAGSPALRSAVEPEARPASRVELGGGPQPAGMALREAPPLSLVQIPPVADPIPQPPPIRIEGTVVVLDELGIEHAAQSGSLALRVSRSGERSAHEVEVNAGRWQLEVPGSNFGRPFLTVRVEDGSLGGRGGVPAEEQERDLVVPEDGTLALRLQWLPEARLHVRARDSGLELEEVFLYEVPPEEVYSSDRGRRHHPGPAARAKERAAGPSPVRIPALPRVWRLGRAFHARSPGYAWGSVEINPFEGGEHELLLDPAGELELVVGGQVRDPSTRLWLCETDGACRFDQPLESTGSIVLEDLPAGRYTAEALLARRPRVLLGSAQVVVVAGRRAVATLDIQPPPTSELVPFAGVLVLPAEWELGDFHLTFSLPDTKVHGMIPGSDMAGSGDRYRWAAPSSPPGRYEVELVELGFHVQLDTGPAGTLDALIEVPPPCSVAVSCLDERTGQEVTTARVVWWSGPWGPGVKASRNEASRRWEFRAPRGRISLRALEDRYDGQESELVVGPGTNEAVLRLRPLVGIRVVLREGKESVSWPARLETLDGVATGEATFSREYCEIHVAQPGTYRLVVPSVPGYEEVAEETVTLDYAELPVREIQLRRRP